MRAGNKQILVNAGLAAMFAAGFNSDWGKAQFAALKQDLEVNLKPYVPWVALAGLVFFMGRK